MLTPFHSAASLIKAAACLRGCPVSSEMVNKAEMFCPHPAALKGRGGEDYYSVKKNKGLYIQAPVWGSIGELSSCSFLMCFSLPESNSFPGPRQLHINWPRRRCQGYSAQVLWRCHRQLNIDLEVCSYSLLFLSLFLPLFLCLCIPPKSLHVLFIYFLSQTHTALHSASSFSRLHSLIPPLTFFLLHPLDVSSLLSVPFLLFPWGVSPSHSLF